MTMTLTQFLESVKVKQLSLITKKSKFLYTCKSLGSSLRVPEISGYLQYVDFNFRIVKLRLYLNHVKCSVTRFLTWDDFIKSLPYLGSRFFIHEA